MNVVLAVFRSRTHTHAFSDAMRRLGCRCTVINTPAEAHVGCGISAKFYLCDLPRARIVIEKNRLSSFGGFYQVNRITGRTVVKKI